MTRVLYLILLITLSFQDITILSAIPPAPAPTPTYAPAYTPTPTFAPTLAPMPPPSSPSPPHQNNGGSPPLPPSSPPPQLEMFKGISKGMSGGQKAGLAFGVIAGAALVGFGGMVYAKRRKNIRRSRLINSVQLSTPFRRMSP